MTGPSTRAVHAGVPAGEQGAPLVPGPVLAAPFHLRGDPDTAPFGYGRDGNPTWSGVEAALGQIEEAEAVLFSSGMAAACAVLEPALGAGDVLVAVRDGYPGVRGVAADRLAPRGVEVRLVPTDTSAIVAACDGATMVWVESPSNPGLDVCDIPAIAAAAHAAGGRLVVDNTLCTPLGQRPLDLGADAVMYSATKALSGHSDLVLGAVATRDPEWPAALRKWRSQGGSIAGPFEAWLLHRSLPTLALRLGRQSANAAHLAGWLRRHPDVRDVRHPSGQAASAQMSFTGPLVSFTLEGAERAQRFLGALELVAEATSFGGVHSTAERRGRWGSDDVDEGFIRFSCGCEDVEDLLADVEQALAASAGS
ncbi:MAG TPA: cystathionine gamma-lyase [Solirubrobacteraceae bacterium]|nr:cystathionine gamma-lyase [Solirubrobacteraceae bacterium]